MQKTGAVILSVWCGLNSLVAAWVTAVTIIGGSPPALHLLVPDSEVANIDRRALSVIAAQAAIANPLILAVCALVMVLVWKGVREDVRWAWPTVAAVLLPVQLFGFVSDHFLGGKAAMANVISTVVLLAGLALTARGRSRGGEGITS